MVRAKRCPSVTFPMNTRERKTVSDPHLQSNALLQKDCFHSSLLWCWTLMCCFLLLNEGIKGSVKSLCCLLSDCGHSVAGDARSEQVLACPYHSWILWVSGLPETRGFFLSICFMDICGLFRHNHYDLCIFQLHTLWLFLQSAVEPPSSSISKQVLINS